MRHQRIGWTREPYRHCEECNITAGDTISITEIKYTDIVVVDLVSIEDSKDIFV